MATVKLFTMAVILALDKDRSLQSPNDGPLFQPARGHHGPFIPLPILPVTLRQACGKAGNSCDGRR
jgi:hypothetical protein